MSEGVFAGPWSQEPDMDAVADMALEQRIDFYTNDILARQKAQDRARERAGEGGLLRAVALVTLMKQGVPAPTLLASRMLYAGGMHSISGPPDSGKTTQTLWWALQLMRSGQRVLFLDEEGGPEIVTEKLIAMGAEIADMEYLTYVPFPGRSWTGADILALHDLACNSRARLILFDSSAAFLARAGLDENSASDVTNFWSRVLTPLARDIGAAVVIIDHDTKSSEGSRYARGSGAKLASCDVAYKVEMLRPFTREADGLLRVTVTKDRRGWLHRTWRAMVQTGSGTINLCLEHEADQKEEDRATWSPVRHRVYDVLSIDPQPTNVIVIKSGYEAGTVRRELDALVGGCYARRSGHDSDDTSAMWTKER